MKKSYNKAFTLVELLAVIVILAIILVIAVPKIMDVISSSKKSTLETSVKMIASTAEKTKMQNTILGKEDATITCDSVAKLSSSDYENCSIKFDGNTAKVTVKGKGKFEGLTVCKGTKNEATATSSEEGCPKEQYSIEGKEWSEIVAAVQSGEYEFEVGETNEVDLLNNLGTHTLRIANTTPCEGLNLSSQTACGLVLEFADVITNHVMNSTSTNAGGFPESEMYSYLNTDATGIYNSLPSELKNARPPSIN